MVRDATGGSLRLWQEGGLELFGLPALVVGRPPSPVAYEREVGAFAGEGPDDVGGLAGGEAGLELVAALEGLCQPALGLVAQLVVLGE